MSIRSFLGGKPLPEAPPLEPAIPPADPIETVMQRRDRLRAEAEERARAEAEERARAEEAARPRLNPWSTSALMVLDTARALLEGKEDAESRAARLLIERAVDLLTDEKAR